MNEDVNTTLLIADDDPSHLLLVEAALAGAGFMVHTAEDGVQAVERFDEVDPDCVILDVMMPKLSGIDACREIRKKAENRLVPVLMLTGRNDLTAISDAYAAGASDFAQKGMNPRLLVERVRFLLRDRELREELHASRSKLLLAQSIARVGHWELDVDGRTLHVSPMIGQLLGFDAKGPARYEDFVALLDPQEQDAVRMAFVNCATGNGRFGFDHRIPAPDGSTICLHQEADLVPGAGGASAGIVMVTLQDLTRLDRAEAAVRRLSYFDPITGLPNRRHLAEQVSRALEEPGETVATAVVAFRVHNFDRVVQAHGREPASRLIQELARHLEVELERLGQAGTILWRAESPSVCRSSDGELGVLLRSRIGAEHVATVTHAVLESVSAKAQQTDAEYVPAISAGIALAEGTADAEQLLGNAHAAAERATDPRSCVLHSPMPQAQLRRRLAIESSLRGAVERRELQLVYQPRVAAESLELTGVECLVRWEHPQYGTIRPEEFISIAQESGIVDDIGRWMLDEACRQMAAWRHRYERRFFASVHVLARQLRDPRLGAAVQAALERHSLPADSIKVEISERTITEAPEAAYSLLEELQGYGLRIGIDDFGTGHSSLGRVRRIAFNSIKLDPALMAELYTDPWIQGVTTAVLGMARSNQIRTVADEIDDPATLEMLRALGFDEVQGPCVAHPMKAREFEEWLERGAARHLMHEISGELDDDLEVSDGTIDDIMKWANG